MKLTKSTQIATTLVATTIAFAALTGDANAALSLLFTQNANSTTTVTLTATNFTVSGLSEVVNPGGASTFIAPNVGRLAFTGATDVFTTLSTAYSIPIFTFGTGTNDSVATLLNPANPYISLSGDIGRLNLFVGHESDDISNFVASATYSGDLAANGISTMPQSFNFDNGQVFTINTQVIPEPSSAIFMGLSVLGILARRSKIK
jgi:hypothetical protein